MSRGVRYYICRSCGLAVFPERALCPRCGGAAWRPEVTTSGIVEDSTTLQHARGRELDTPAHLGTVRLDAGPMIIARLDATLSPGTRVVLETADGAPYAREPR